MPDPGVIQGSLPSSPRKREPSKRWRLGKASTDASCRVVARQKHCGVLGSRFRGNDGSAEEVHGICAEEARDFGADATPSGSADEACDRSGDGPRDIGADETMVFISPS